MRVAACVLAMIGLSLGSAGCSLFDKKSSPDGRASSSNAQGRDNGRSPGNDSDPFYSTNAQTTQTAQSGKTNPDNRFAPDRFGGVLAGQIIDVNGQPAERAFVRCVNVDEKDNADAPDAQVTPGGYFWIEGLRPGAHYELIARSNEGGQMAAGMKVAAAPNAQLRIYIDPKLASADTPPLPGAPVYQGKSTTPTTPPTNSSTARTPGGDVPSLQAVRVPQAPVEFERVSQIPDLPISVRVQVAAAPPPSIAGPTVPIAPPSNQRWMPPSTPASTWPPTLDIVAPRAPSPAIQDQTPIPVPPSFGQPPPPNLITPPPASGEPPPPPMFPNLSNSERLDTPSPNVPLCEMRNLQLINFALNEINGSVWEFRQRQGKVVLLDFWATNCQPCRETIPKLVALQNRYGSRGLEIVGIACEKDGSVQEQAHRVNAMSQRFQANYRQLLSSGSDCPVRNRFHIQGFPTLVLIDGQGVTLWQHRGQPNNADMDQLEQILQRQLPKQS